MRTSRLEKSCIIVLELEPGRGDLEDKTAKPLTLVVDL